jgi:hypothetical protein
MLPPSAASIIFPTLVSIPRGDDGTEKMVRPERNNPD